MNRVKQTFMGLIMLTLPASIIACVTTPPQVPVQVMSKVFAKTGDNVYLFHGGSKMAKEEFCVNALVPVYRYDARYSSIGSTSVQRHEVGKIRITKDLGDFYVEGVVVEGSIKNGDTAVQPQSGCLVRLPEPQEK